MNQKNQISKLNGFNLANGICEFIGLDICHVNINEYEIKIQKALNACPGLENEVQYYKALTEGLDDETYNKEYDEMWDKYENFDILIDELSYAYSDFLKV